MISSAMAIFEIMPNPSHRVRIGASAKTGTAWLKTMIGSTMRRARGETIR
jgi:hypothetical protein